MGSWDRIRVAKGVPMVSVGPCFGSSLLELMVGWMSDKGPACLDGEGTFAPGSALSRIPFLDIAITPSVFVFSLANNRLSLLIIICLPTSSPFNGSNTNSIPNFVTAYIFCNFSENIT